MLIRQDIRVHVIKFFYIFFFVFLVHRLFFPSFGMAERCMSYVLYPFLKIHASVTRSMHAQAEHKKSKEELEHELAALRASHDQLLGTVHQLEAQQLFLKDSQTLREYGQRYETTDKRIAKILMKISSDQEDAILIEGGSNCGFAQNDILVYQNSLVGRIIAVYPWYSKALLISDKRCRISVQLGADAQGICCGQNNGKILLEFIPHFKEILPQELVFSTGQGMMYPSGFVVGKVGAITTDLVCHSIEVDTAFGIQDIEYVYVFLKEKGG